MNLSASPNPPPAMPQPSSRRLHIPLGHIFWTYFLLGIIIAVFIVEETLPFYVNAILPYLPSDYASFSSADFAGGSDNPLVLILLGGNFHPLVETGQVWRFFTSMFIHIGFMHLFFNGYALFVLGGEMERVYGQGRYLIIYVLSGLFGSLISFAFSQAQLSAGASGAIFGIIGMQVAYFYKQKALLGTFGRNRLTNAAMIIVINLIFGFSVPGIDNLAHLGGLVAGTILGYGLTPNYQVIQDPFGQLHAVDQATLRSQLWIPLMATVILIGGTIAALQS